MRSLKITAGVFLVLALAYAGGFFLTGGSVWIYRFWAPQRAEAERQVFVNTPSYIQGKTEYLSRLRMEYEASKDSDQKSALRTLIVSEASSVDNSKLPADLAGFVARLKGQ